MTLRERLKVRLLHGNALLMGGEAAWVNRRFRTERPVDRDRALHFLRRHFRIIGIRRWTITWHEDPTTLPQGPYTSRRGAMGVVLFPSFANRLFPNNTFPVGSSSLNTTVYFGSYNTSIYDAAWDSFASLPLGLERQGFLFKAALHHAGEAGLFGFGVTKDGQVHALEVPERVHVEPGGRVHNADGPALVWPTGLGSIYAWHGMLVAPDREWIIARPEDLSPGVILSQPNAEIRRMMIEKFTPARLIRESAAEQLHHDDFGELWSLSIPGDEALVMVKVVNSTPEPDGTYKDYWLRVPPGTRTAREGVAWTFGETDARKYQPKVQT